MLDYGLLVSLALVLIVPRVWAKATRADFGEQTLADIVSGPLMGGLVAARLGYLAFEDPGAILRIRELLIFRSGMEFWVAVGVGALILMRSSRDQVALVAPFMLAGYATYEATCVTRGVCFGPQSPIGLRPTGFLDPVLPMGFLVALFVATGAWFLAKKNFTPGVTILTALALVAIPRAVASFWLPKIGDGLTRPHLISIAVALVASPLAWLKSR